MLEPIVSSSNLVPEAAKNKIINVSYQSTNISHHKKRQSETLNRQMPRVNQHLNWYFHLLEYGFLELIINGGNVQFGLKDHGLVYVWDVSMSGMSIMFGINPKPLGILLWYQFRCCITRECEFSHTKGCNMTHVCEVDFVVH